MVSNEVAFFSQSLAIRTRHRFFSRLRSALSPGDFAEPLLPERELEKENPTDDPFDELYLDNELGRRRRFPTLRSLTPTSPHLTGPAPSSSSFCVFERPAHLTFEFANQTGTPDRRESMSFLSPSEKMRPGWSIHSKTQKKSLFSA